MASFKKLIENFQNKKILVIGDIILDQYIWGKVERISPEAPVPIVTVEKETCRLGGAANVAANICSLGGKVSMIGVIGFGEHGNKLFNMLSDVGVDISNIIQDEKRPTTVKTRVIAHHQHVVRIDNEVKNDIEESLRARLIDCSKDVIPSVDAILISDYDKGLISKPLLDEIITQGKRYDKPVVIDPKMHNFWNYAGATTITPNLKEASTAVNLPIKDEADLINVGEIIFTKLGLKALLITRGEDGISLFQANSSSKNQIDVIHIPAVARDVFDVTGAGDTVIAVYTLALSAGADFISATKISNYAAGIVVGEVGTACVKPDELLSFILKQNGQ